MSKLIIIMKPIYIKKKKKKADATCNFIALYINAAVHILIVRNFYWLYWKSSLQNFEITGKLRLYFFVRLLGFLGHGGY